MFHLPDIDQTFSRFDARLDQLEQDMSQMVTLLKHIDKTLGKILQIQEVQLAATVNSFNEKDVLTLK